MPSSRNIRHISGSLTTANATRSEHQLRGTSISTIDVQQFQESQQSSILTQSQQSQ